MEKKSREASTRERYLADKLRDWWPRLLAPLEQGMYIGRKVYQAVTIERAEQAKSSHRCDG